MSRCASAHPGAAFLFLFLAGCGGGPAAEPLTAVDSAGITVVTNHTDPGSLPTWTIGPQPRLDLGVLEGDKAQQFYRVMDALRLNSDRVLVVNAGTQELRLFEPSGELMETMGGEGEGPGEYRFPFRVFRLRGDSLLVYDLALARFTVLGPDRGVVRTFRPERALLNEPVIAGLMGDSLIVSHEPIYSIPSSGFDTMQSRIAFFDLDGRGQDSLMVPTARMGRLADRGLVGSPHFEARTAFAAGHDGLWLGTGRTAEVSLYGPDREITRVVRWGAEPRPVTNEAISQLVEHQIARAGPGREQETRSIYENVEWLVLARDGRMLARIELPARLRVHEVGRDYVLGTLQDEMDVEHVVLWDIDEP